MKKSFPISALLIALLLSVFSFQAVAADITSTFKVNGTCGSCKKKIEGSLRVKGVKKVNWDKETHVVTVTFNPSHITLDEIHHRIAAVGYDTDKIKADDAVYAQLDACCQYEREK